MTVVAANDRRGRRQAPAPVEDWDDVGRRWLAAAQPQRLWRGHADAVNANLIERWLPRGLGVVLKTDLFDEAVGAGQTATLSARAARVLGVDLSAVVVETAARRAPDLRCSIGDVRRLAFRDGRFDAVISLSTLDHFGRVEEIDAALAELRRVLRAGGLLILTLDNPANPVVALRRLAPGPLARSGLVPYHCGPTLSRAAMARAVEGAGFRVEAETTVLHCPRAPGIALAAAIDRWGGGAAERAFLRTMSMFELLGRTPLRGVTGYFGAVRARRL